jgi:hypothetical protein
VGLVPECWVGVGWVLVRQPRLVDVCWVRVSLGSEWQMRYVMFSHVGSRHGLLGMADEERCVESWID